VCPGLRVPPGWQAAGVTTGPPLPGAPVPLLDHCGYLAVGTPALPGSRKLSSAVSRADPRNPCGYDEGAGVTYLQAFVIALVQGVTELFPVSSLGHSVLVPAWLGGSWQTLVTQSSQQDSGSSFYLAYIVALHCATALALLWYFRADWIRIIRGFVRSLPASARASLDERRLRLDVAGKDERLAWMIIFATIPVGLAGVALEHTFRVLLAKPEAAAVLLFINGLILLGAEAMRRCAERRGQEGVQAAADRPSPAFAASGVSGTAAAGTPGRAGVSGHPGGPGYGYPAIPPDPGYPANPGYRGYTGVPGHPAASGYPDGAGRATISPPAGAMRQPASHRKPAGGRAAADIDAAERSDARIARLSYADGMLIGATQILALLAGISRSGITMTGGLWRGLDHEDAARFAFLLATPVILAAGVLKVPSLLGPAGAHIHGQVVLGVIVCGIAAYLSVRFIMRWFQTRTLTPFAIYCLAFGALSILRFL
jgi:undecaprenyl-diphosphatase